MSSKPPSISLHAQSALGLATLTLLCCGTWALSHGYQGIFHDASLYTLQALARLSPNSLDQDVFLRLGSQDHYTLFSPLFAAATRLLGAEHAAAALTLILQVVLLYCAWRLARTVMPAAPALLGIAVLIAIPGYYGPDRIFTSIESFLTPRMAAEALTLGSLAAALTEHRMWTLVLIAMAALIHPLMAAAGIAALFCLHVIIPYPRWRVASVIGLLLWLVMSAYALPAGIGGRFDPTWLELIKNRSPYLFLRYWSMDDWGRAAVLLATLAVGIRTLPGSQGRTLCVVAVLTTVGGLLLTFIACDELHLVLFTQLQPWRWQWLGTVVAALLLPEILRTRWQDGMAGRTTATLLLAAWIFAADEFALVAAVATLASVPFVRRLSPDEARWVFWGACGMLALALVWRVASNLQFTEAYYLNPHIPLWRRQAMSFARDGAAPMILISLAWWLGRSSGRRPGLIVLAALSAGACALLLPQTWSSWTAREFPPQFVARFAPMREHIPAGAQVFWPDSPVATWLLLDRPSYLSVLQTSGMVFSRDAAVELKRRAMALSSVIPPQLFLGWSKASPSMNLVPANLRQICQTSAFEYLVTGVDLGVAPVTTLPPESWPATHGLRLYRCPMGVG